jgi:CRISPR-associated protein Csy3
MTKLTTASVLAFERKLDVSDGFFWQTDSANSADNPSPVLIREKSVRGTISNRLKTAIASDPSKLDAETQKANLQTVDVAALDDDKDTLIVRWSCKVLPFTGTPNICNNKEYQARLIETVGGYLQEHGVKDLAQRYAINIINARWLWRNRLGSETISINVTCNTGGTSEEFNVADSRALGLNDFTTKSEQVESLAALMEAGLLGNQFVILNIEARAKVGYGQEVYPSQELILDTGNSKSKVLYKINDKAGMHSQKISNAIRTIDTWYEDADFPIAVEPYGSVTTLGTAFRQSKQKQDFYNLFDNWILKGETPATEQQHYVIAVLIRGGVFGASGKE